MYSLVSLPRWFNGD